MIYRGGNLQPENTRSSKRFTIRAPIECAYEIEDCDMSVEGTIKTFTTDISRTGLGMYSECPAKEGQLVKIFLKHVFKDPILAEVRWCRQDMDALYKIGMRYLDFSPMDLAGQG